MDLCFINDEYSSNIDDALRFAQKNNLRYIELRNIDGKNICDLSLDKISQIADKIARAGILVSTIASPFLSWHEGAPLNIGGQSVDETQYFTKLMDIADILGETPTQVIVNGTGSYTCHSAVADCGITGRKLACDFYSTACPVGGGAPWTKDATKADLTLNSNRANLL